MRSHNVDVFFEDLERDHVSWRTEAGERQDMKFILGFISAPAMTASVTPSSRALARAVVQDIDLGDADAVLEYGPGTGVLTDLILPELKPGAKFAAIELNPHFVQMLKTRYPSAQVYEDSVGNVEKICRLAGMQSVDCIISGLPWALFSEAEQMRFLEATIAVLKPGGQFATFTYLHSRAILPGAKRFANLLPNYFRSVTRSRVVWLNFPPAFVYRCRR
jgi:phospholipid N-methyltransferase